MTNFSKRVDKLESQPPSPYLIAKGMKQFRDSGELPENPRVADYVRQIMDFVDAAEEVTRTRKPISRETAEDF